MYKTFSELTLDEAAQVGGVIDPTYADPWNFVYYVVDGVVVYAVTDPQRVTA